MPANYVLLEKITVGSAGASSVTFSGIPQTGYTDLVVKMSARTNRSAIEEAIFVEFNGSGGTAYSSRRLFGTGSVAASDFGSSQSSAVFYSVNGGTSTGSTFGSAELYIPNYTSSSNKSFSVDAITENNATAVTTGLAAGLWANTSAITSIKLTPGSSGAYLEGSTFYLYGVAKLGTTPEIVPYATGGDTIMTDGTYWYHTFTSSGTFTPAKGLSCDYLVVAGGGAGYNGGGGAGGLRSTVTATGGGGSLETAKSFASGTAYTITIGAGGASYGTSGSNSSIAGTGLTTITSIGGGGSGPAQVGGSGGGGGDGSSGAAGTANQGYAGGNTNGVGVYAGGGGAGAVGSNGPAGAGGAGVAISALASPTGTGVSNYYAGGGGGAASTAPGGAGGAGGGGSGEGGTTGRSAGVANTGGGGGGAYNGVGGPSLSYGGSGIVIVRYAV